MNPSDMMKMRADIAIIEDDLVATLPPLDDQLEEMAAVAPAHDGTSEVPLTIIRPKKGQDPMPLILLFHGGGLFCGSSKMLLRPAREFALDFGAVVVLSTYRKAPEHPFPASMLDGWNVANWLSQPGNSFGADLTCGFIVGGHSAGGQLAATVIRQTKDLPLAHDVTGCFLGIPSLLCDDNVPPQYRDLWTSMTEWKSDYGGIEYTNSWLRQIGADVRSPWFSPLNSPHGLASMPPTYIQVGGKDVWRDDGVVYNQALGDAGVKSHIDVFPELGHASYTAWAQGDGPNNPPELREKTMAGMRWLLSCK